MDIQISLPAELREQAESLASAQGITLEEFVRNSIVQALKDLDASDSLFTDDAVFLDSGSSDLASNHDAYLYGDAS